MNISDRVRFLEVTKRRFQIVGSANSFSGSAMLRGGRRLTRDTRGNPNTVFQEPRLST